MMTSPESYVSEFKDKTYNELLVERDRLIKSIKEFERNIGKEDDTDCIIVSPSPEVVYQVELEYLGKLCELISNKYNLEFVGKH